MDNKFYNNVDNEKITLKNMYKFGRSIKTYAIWRRPLVYISYYSAYVLYKLGLKNPTILSIMMIVFGLFGALLFFSSIKWVNIVGWFLILFSYFIDLNDGKLARMLGKADMSNKLLDTMYHAVTISVVLTAFAFKILIIDTDKALKIIAMFVPILFLLKMIMSSTYNLISNDLTRDNLNFEKRNDEEYKSYMSNKKLSYLFEYFFRYFLDLVDILVPVIITILFELEVYFMMFMFAMYFFIFVYTLYSRYLKLLKKENGKIHRIL